MLKSTTQTHNRSSTMTMIELFLNDLCVGACVQTLTILCAFKERL